MEILAYTEDNFATALSNSYTSADLVKTKNHFSYFNRYLGPTGLDAKSILIERDYISRDYLHDYASYYALCFEKYDKVCTRLHFFNRAISVEEFKDAIVRPAEEEQQIWKHYLGFVVIKPIPFKLIGYTVLKTYSPDQPDAIRNFWGLRDYTVHLYGSEVKIRSLAFQEQDTVLAACATTAIWSMLNKAAIDFHSVLKSPSQITSDADKISPDGSRLFPNKGLSLLQISQAILNSGLVSEIKEGDKITQQGKVVSNSLLKKILNAYSPIGIPIILVISVPNGGAHGLHAITVSGFKSTGGGMLAPQSTTSFVADNIERIYAHDDQWGPFARINLINEYELESPWTENDPQKRPTIVKNIVVPLYPKIRISYQDLEVITLGLDTILTYFFQNKIISDLVWDIKVVYSEAFKADVKNSILDQDVKVEILAMSLPKYVWVVTCLTNDVVLFWFIFDATNVNNAMIGLDVISFLPTDANDVLVQFMKKNRASLKNLLAHTAKEEYYDFFVKRLTKSR